MVLIFDALGPARFSTNSRFKQPQQQNQRLITKCYNSSPKEAQQSVAAPRAVFAKRVPHFGSTA
jgi:hypothetical protein